jgi:hypothetical protein
MKDGAAIVDVHNGPVWKHAIHAGDEDIPLVGAVEIVAHKEPVLQESQRITKPRYYRGPE